MSLVICGWKEKGMRAWDGLFAGLEEKEKGLGLFCYWAEEGKGKEERGESFGTEGSFGPIQASGSSSSRLTAGNVLSWPWIIHSGVGRSRKEKEKKLGHLGTWAGWLGKGHWPWWVLGRMEKER
ncbi:hypothetical protein Drorol1_Dr00000678 [Drosera rotundifolia]